MTADHSSRPGAVLFDIDGTLVDSTYLHVHAWLAALHEVGHPADAWRVHRCIGMGSDHLLGDLLGRHAGRLGDRAEELHSENYRKLAPLLRPFDRARELVAAVAARGARVVLASSAAPDELRRLRAVLEIDDVVHAVTAAEDVRSAKPDPDLVSVALERAEAPPERAVFVGDAVWDVVAANKVGVPTIGVLTGGIAAAELTGAGAVAVYENAAGLLSELDTSPLAAVWS